MPDWTDEQIQAFARRSGSLLLAAGAGSGKTSVLVERYVRAVIEDGIAPGRILAITFTERAAWELRERLRARLRELDRRDLARDVEAAAIGTFHGFCARALRADPIAAGLDPGFSILEQSLADRMRIAAFADALQELIERESAAAVDLAAAYGVDRLRRMVLAVHGELRSRGQQLPRLPAPQLSPSAGAGEPAGAGESAGAGEQARRRGRDDEALTAVALIGSLLEALGAAYERRKRARRAVDFDDLELLALTLLREHEDLRRQWSERLDLLMVDELQDTNRRQLALLQAIERENLFTVGDEWQSIYGFRHADVSIFRERKAELARVGASLALTSNFRSRPAVIDVVNAVFTQRFGEGYTPLRAARERASATEPAVELLIADTQGWANDPELAQAVAAGLPEATLWRQAEARMLALRVAELVLAGRAPGEVAVLLRSTKDLPVYERALAERGLPTLATVGGFWDAQEVGDLIAYLRALANPLDELALYGVLASPLVGLSGDALALLARARRDSERRLRLWETIRDGLTFGEPGVEGARGGLSLDEPDAGGARRGLGFSELEAGDARRLSAFRRRFLAERARLQETSIPALLRQVIAATRYDEHLLRDGSGAATGRQALANVRKLARLASEFERSEGRDLRGFLDHVMHLTEDVAVREPDAPSDSGEAEAVRLMSIHAAKGLEFPVVCVADLGRLPNRSDVPDLLVDGERVGLRLASLASAKTEPALDFAQLAQERELAASEEEDRILYVAMTRAKELLLLSGAASFARWPQPSRACPPVAWLAPALLEDLPGRLAAALAGAPPPAAAPREPLCRLSTAVGAAADVLRAPAPEPLPVLAEPPVVTPATERLEKPKPVLPREDPPPPGPVSAGGSLSYTTLAELERCGYRYYLERVLRLPEADVGMPGFGIAGRLGEAGRTGGARAAGGSRAAGEVPHRLLEGLDFARPAGPSIAAVERVAGELGIALGEAAHREIAELLSGLRATPLAARLAAASRVGREQPFAFSLGEAEPLVTGVFDAIATERDGTRLVVDYKSGAVGADEDLDALTQRDFGVQRLIYALAALCDGAERVEVVHWFLQRPGDPVHARYAAADRARLEAELREHVLRARVRGFAVSENPHRRLCITCPGRTTGLCSWSEQETLREVRNE